MVFGKNYDKEIEKINEGMSALIKNNNKVTKAVDSLEELFSFLQDSVLKLAKVQAQHKHFITFVTNHGTFNPDCQEDLMKMIKEIADIDDIKFPKDKKKK